MISLKRVWGNWFGDCEPQGGTELAYLHREGVGWWERPHSCFTAGREGDFTPRSLSFPIGKFTAQNSVSHSKGSGQR